MYTINTMYNDFIEDLIKIKYLRFLLKFNTIRIFELLN